ncbi:MAG: putative DNA binding domain-containing protein [Bacillota bacterium]|nr:putative DNA binding domain-containing protein [Bacillota bacterium]
MREGNTLEIQEKITEGFLKTVTAFANFGDGSILFGIDDKGNAVGIENAAAACQDIESQITENISPKPDFVLNVQKKRVIELKVFEGTDKPYFYRGKAYRRTGTTSMEVDRNELKALALEGSGLFYDQLASTEIEHGFTATTSGHGFTATTSKHGFASTESEPGFHYLEEKLKSVLQISALNSDILCALGFYTRDTKFNNAAALFADRNKHPGIDIARFGETISVILDRETFSHISLLEQYDRAVDMYRKYYQYEVIEGFRRERRELVPEAAFRTALANALLQRACFVNAHIRIAMFKDKIEITTPGGLPSSISKEEYLSGRVLPLQYPIIGNLFFRLGLTTTLGTSITRIDEAYKGFVMKPNYRILDSSITVELPTTTAVYETSSDEAKIISALKGGMILSGSEIADRLGYSKSKVLRLMKKLTEKNYISIQGGGRSTKYKLR